MYIVHSSSFLLDLLTPCVKLPGSGEDGPLRFVLLLGFLSLTAGAVFVTMRLRTLNRKAPSFPPGHPNNVVPFPRQVVISKSR